MSSSGETAFVVSLLVSKPASSELYLGVRRCVSTSDRHPGVLSTLTMRVPPEVFLAACKYEGLDDVPEIECGQVEPFADSQGHAVGRSFGMALLPVYVAEALLTRKVGVGDALVAGQLLGTLRPLGLAADLVDDPKGGGEAEQTVMLTYELTVTAGLEHLPRASGSYSQLAWVDGSALQASLDANDALLLLPDADPFEVCIHGLCVRSAAVLAASRFGTTP